jgi:hypothetical protein
MNMHYTMLQATVNAIIIYTSHPLPTEHNRIAMQLVTAYPCLADRDADIPEVSKLQVKAIQAATSPL